jgi:hypothetical protein
MISSTNLSSNGFLVHGLLRHSNRQPHNLILSSSRHSLVHAVSAAMFPTTTPTTMLTKLPTALALRSLNAGAIRNVICSQDPQLPFHLLDFLYQLRLVLVLRLPASHKLLEFDNFVFDLDDFVLDFGKAFLFLFFGSPSVVIVDTLFGRHFALSLRLVNGDV